MADDLTRWKRDNPLRLLIALTGIHSLALGVALLIGTRTFLATFGFESGGSIFFPSQSGVFLLIMGTLYLAALREPVLVWTIVLSKGFAVPFLVVHLLLLDGPPSLWLALAGDASMLLAIAVLLIRHRRAAALRSDTAQSDAPRHDAVAVAAES